MRELSFDGMVGSVEALFAGRLLTVGVSLASKFEGVCLFERSLGAIETSVFVEKRSAFVFEEGSRLAAKSVSSVKIEL